MKDYYYLLGVEYAATRAEVAEAYRKLATKFHPDKNQGDAFFEMRFKEITEAYATLSDREKRSLYDMEWRALNLHREGYEMATDEISAGGEIIANRLQQSGWLYTVKMEVMAAIRAQRWLFLVGLVFLVLSSVYLAINAGVKGPQLIFDSLLILFMSAAFSGAITLLFGFFKSSGERFSMAILKNIPIYLIIICLFRMFVIL